MARLTTFSRFLITLAIVGALFFAVKHFLPNLGKTSLPETTIQDARTKDAKTKDDASDVYNPNKNNTTTTSTSERPTFNYTAPEPINGKLKGVVELGATGFNSFIIRVDANKNWKLEKSQFGASLVKEGMATDQDIKNGLKSYIADMLAFGVGGKDIHFVVSSGAKKEAITTKIIQFLNELHYVVNTVTPEQEGRLGLKSCLPKAYTNNGFVLDIGSGNTKISYTKAGSIQSFDSYGAKYFQNQVSDATVSSDIASKAQNVPTSNRDIAFILGGIPFELAKQVRNGKERYTVLKAPSDYKAEGDKQRCGINIYNAVAKTTGCKQFVFDWDANFTIGFLLDTTN